MTYIPQPLYNKILEVIPIVCVDCIIIYNHHVLFVKRDREPLKGEWFLPGGRLHKDESLEECALRKAKEETGLDCLLGPMVHIDSTIYPGVHSVNVCYLLGATHDKVTLDETSTAYNWADVENLEKFIANDYVRDCLAKAIRW